MDHIYQNTKWIRMVAKLLEVRSDKNQLDDHLSAARKIMDQSRSSKFIQIHNLKVGAEIWWLITVDHCWSPCHVPMVSPWNWPQGSDNDPARRRPAPATKGNGVRLKGDENQLDVMFNSIFVGQRDNYWILPTELDRKIYRTLSSNEECVGSTQTII